VEERHAEEGAREILDEDVICEVSEENKGA
jgi:hypothetical protein